MYRNNKKYIYIISEQRELNCALFIVLAVITVLNGADFKHVSFTLRLPVYLQPAPIFSLPKKYTLHRQTRPNQQLGLYQRESLRLEETTDLRRLIRWLLGRRFVIVHF